jgi:hypothetical protein
MKGVSLGLFQALSLHTSRQFEEHYNTFAYPVTHLRFLSIWHAVSVLILIESIFSFVEFPVTKWIRIPVSI